MAFWGVLYCTCVAVNTTKTLDSLVTNQSAQKRRTIGCSLVTARLIYVTVAPIRRQMKKINYRGSLLYSQTIEMNMIKTT